MKLYRAMCDTEANETLKYKSLSWNSKKKWFSTFELVTMRVRDGLFNNSSFKNDRYCRLLEFEIDEPKLGLFDKCGYNEFMLDIKKANNFKFNVKEVSLNG